MAKRLEKLRARTENLAKYHAMGTLPAGVTLAAVKTIVDRLTTEWPGYFSWEPVGRILRCDLTGESLEFSPTGELLNGHESSVQPPYLNAFDALACQIPEDCALLLEGDGLGKTAMLHVCSPSHWAPEEKLGLSFLELHGPVPHFERIAKALPAIVDAMVNKGPFVRFVWSFVTDTRLNHHPVPPPGIEPASWTGRSFNPTLEVPFYLRIERQTTVPVPEAHASLFFIGLSFLSGAEIKASDRFRTQLISALHSMSPDARRYKGVEHCFDDLVGWLESR
ncbi:MAG: DUF3445 domain-containing protein [Bdellovibrionales bacterium]|nr:DUF3445 domain-containing protein [Bdellovibrionales bacterium]